MGPPSKFQIKCPDFLRRVSEKVVELSAVLAAIASYPGTFPIAWRRPVLYVLLDITHKDCSEKACIGCCKASILPD